MGPSGPNSCKHKQIKFVGFKQNLMYSFLTLSDYTITTIFLSPSALLMPIVLTLRETRGNTILWAYRGPSVPLYAMAGSVVPLMIYLCFRPGVHITTTVWIGKQTRMSQLLARHCNCPVGPCISVGQLLHVHVYDRTAWKPHIFPQMIGPKKWWAKGGSKYSQKGAGRGGKGGMDFEKKIGVIFNIAKKQQHFFPIIRLEKVGNGVPQAPLWVCPLSETLIS